MDTMMPKPYQANPSGDPPLPVADDTRCYIVPEYILSGNIASHLRKIFHLKKLIQNREIAEQFLRFSGSK